MLCIRKYYGHNKRKQQVKYIEAATIYGVSERLIYVSLYLTDIICLKIITDIL